jgi:alanine dehydrogenase
MVRLLKADEIKDLIDLQGAVKCMENVYRQQAAGQVTMFPGASMRSEKTGLILRSGALVGDHRLVLRINNTGSVSHVLVWDSAAANLLAILEYPFSNLRVGGCVGLAVDTLAPEGELRVGVVGSGVVAWNGLRGAAAVRRVSDVRVFSPNPDHAEAYAARARTELGLAATAVTSAEAAARDSGLVLTATTAKESTIEPHWLASNCLVVSAGTRDEVGPDVYRRADRLVMGSKEGEMAMNEWHLTAAVKRAEVSWGDVLDLSTIVAGETPTPRTGITVFREAQAGFCDAVLAAFAVDQAIAKGLGSDW